MAGTKISALGSLSALADASILPVVDSGTNYKLTASALATYTTSKVAWPVTNTTGSSGPTAILIGANANGGSNSVAIGSGAGYQASGSTFFVAIGPSAGTQAGNESVSIGHSAGQLYQGQYTVAIGSGAGTTGQGDYSIAIGRAAGSGGTNHQAANTIILNASGGEFDGINSQTNSFYVTPIRNDTSPSNVMYYNTTTKEVTYGRLQINATVPTTSKGAPGDKAGMIAVGDATGIGYCLYVCNADYTTGTQDIWGRTPVYNNSPWSN
jgi:hypothetical protein